VGFVDQQTIFTPFNTAAANAISGLDARIAKVSSQP